MKYNEQVIYLKSCYTVLKSNKVRMFLTVLGVIISSVIFLLANISIKTYIKSLYSETTYCSNRGVVLSGNIDNNVLNDTKIHYHNISKIEYMPNICSDSKIFKLPDIQINVIPNIVGTGMQFTKYPICSTKIWNSTFDSNIVCGRDLSEEDLLMKKRVVVISEQAAKFFCGKKNPIGCEIKLSLDEGMTNEYFKVIGIYKDSVDENENLKELNTAKKKNNAEINLILNCFVPSTIYQDYNELKTLNVSKMIFYTGNSELKKWEISNYYKNKEDIEISFKEKKVKEINELSVDTKRITNIVLIIIIVISGFNLFNSLMFSIKERISEIGIRKAIGATRFDIVKQFIIEGLIIVIIGTFIAFIFVTLIVPILEFIVEKYTVYDIHIVYKVEFLIELLAYNIIMGTIFSIIPAYKAASINIVDAIRFD